MRRFAPVPVVAIILALLASPSSAGPAAPAGSTAATGTSAAADLPPPATTSSIAGSDSKAKQLADCMAVWEPRTHMTKAQWKRTCKTELEPLPTP
jgi:hypothetical protein